jgi:diadenosine tetraphosphate (Ap4A) HIT family hydrolase
VTLDHIWNGWRSGYISGLPDRERDPNHSAFTLILNSGLPDDETYIVHRGSLTFVILNAFPYTVGHMLVLPYRQIADLDELTAAEAGELWATVTTVTKVLKAVYRPKGLNVGINLGQAAGGSISEHLHVHVVPRWAGDSNFMTAVANTRSLSEALVETAAKVRAAWPTP